MSGATASRGYPYATGTDVPDIGVITQALAEAIDADMTATRAIALTSPDTTLNPGTGYLVQSGWTGEGGSFIPELRARGQHRRMLPGHIIRNLTGVSVAAGGWVVVGVITAGHRPVSTAYGTATIGVGGNLTSCRYRVRSTGAVEVQTFLTGTIAAGTYDGNFIDLGPSEWVVPA